MHSDEEIESDYNTQQQNHDVVLDSGATISTTNNKKALLNIRTGEITITGIHGTKHHPITIGDARGLKEVVYFQGCETCLDSLSALQEQGYKAYITDNQQYIICTTLVPEYEFRVYQKTKADGMYRLNQYVQEKYKDMAKRQWSNRIFFAVTDS